MDRLLVVLWGRVASRQRQVVLRGPYLEPVTPPLPHDLTLTPHVQLAAVSLGAVAEPCSKEREGEQGSDERVTQGLRVHTSSPNLGRASGAASSVAGDDRPIARALVGHWQAHHAHQRRTHQAQRDRREDCPRKRDGSPCEIDRNRGAARNPLTPASAHGSEERDTDEQMQHWPRVVVAGSRQHVITRRPVESGPVHLIQQRDREMPSRERVRISRWCVWGGHHATAVKT